MCYVVLLSTSADVNLAKFNSDWVRFSPELPQSDAVGALRYEHRWYVGSKSECSCTFRHLYSIELGFGEPVDWYPEDEDEIQATLQLFGVIRELVQNGASVDCVDVWGDSQFQPNSDSDLEVDIAAMTDTAFRLFENHRFNFTNRT